MIENNEISFLLLALALTLLFGFILLRRRKGARPELPTAAPEEKKDFKSLLEKTKASFAQKIDALILSTKQIDSQFIDELEELLYTSDLGPKTVEKLLLNVRSKLSGGELKQKDQVKEALASEIKSILSQGRVTNSEIQSPWVILVVGVNGVGKTTSIGKLAHYYSNQNKKVLVVAGDTFRAAAQSQLAIWGERASVDLYASKTSTEAAAVAYEGVQHGVAHSADVIIVDTAGRLHTKENLMEELKKVKRVIGKALTDAPHETLLVVDANSGQNALVQARHFHEALGLTNILVTKLDGTARGGVIVGIAGEIGVSPKFVGVGEKISDLKSFSAQEFAQALLY